MSTWSLSGTGVQTLSASVVALHVSITTLPDVPRHGLANPLDYYAAGFLRAGDGTAYWDPFPICGGPQWLPLPWGTTTIAYALLNHAVVSVAEVFAPAPLAYPLARLPDVAITSPADTQVLTYQASSSKWINAAAPSGGGGSSTPPAYVMLQDQKTLGTNAGASTANSWVTRDLNTKVTDQTSAVTLASNRITLPAGTWLASISVPAFHVYGHQARLQNVTDAATVLLGTTDYSDNAGFYASTRTTVAGLFTIAASKQLEVQHNTQNSSSPYGLGINASRSTEVYTTAQFWKYA